MPRGHASKVGETNISSNGYHHTRTENGWRLTHHIVAETILGRPLKEEEMVRFKDSDKSNLDPSNIDVVVKKKRPRARAAKLRAKIMEMQDELRNLESQY